MATQPTVQISIHASAKEATLDEQKPFKVVLYISIHASAKEATFPLYLLWMGKRFQSTPPRRRRRKPVRCRKPMHCHFNPRLREGGDNGQIVFTRQGKDFNPRLREGGDLASYANTLVISGFQSTPPRRRRRVEKQYYAPDRLDFNPRLREGGDLSKDNLHLHHSLLFQSTPPRRRRQ